MIFQFGTQKEVVLKIFRRKGYETVKTVLGVRIGSRLASMRLGTKGNVSHTP